MASFTSQKACTVGGNLGEFIAIGGDELLDESICKLIIKGIVQKEWAEFRE